jgi:uncharacterized protein YciI
MISSAYSASRGHRLVSMPLAGLALWGMSGAVLPSHAASAVIEPAPSTARLPPRAAPAAMAPAPPEAPPSSSGSRGAAPPSPAAPSPAPPVPLRSASGAAAISELEKTAPRHYDMTNFQLVFFDAAGDAAMLDEADSARMQKEHLDGLEALMTSGKALAVGSVEGSSTIRGVAVLDVRTTEEAKKLLANDPYLRTGRMLAEYHTWFAAKNIFGKPKSFLDVAPCHLGLLTRPKDAPDLPVEELREIQEGHMNNINAMAESGDLVIAGPMEDVGPLRGIFVFRTESAEKIRDLVARDPAIQAHRLEMELLTWYLSKGVIPPPAPPPGAPTAGAPASKHAPTAPSDQP